MFLPLKGQPCMFNIPVFPSAYLWAQAPTPSTVYHPSWLWLYRICPLLLHIMHSTPQDNCQNQVCKTYRLFCYLPYKISQLGPK